MLKPEKRHSQTLNTKKPKPIEITLTKKPHHMNASQNLGQENFNHSTEKVVSSGLSLVRPLKQKSSNIIESHTLDLKSLKSKQLKLKQQVCPSYKINWGNTPVNNSSRFSQIPTFSLPQENTKELSHLVKTTEYKKYTKEVHDTYATNAFQYVSKIEQNPIAMKDQQPISNHQTKQDPSMNSIKSKIKGLSKGFLRDTKHLSEQNRKEEQKSDQILRQIIQMDSTSSLIQQPFKIVKASNIHEFSNQVKDKVEETQQNKSTQNLILIEENLASPSTLKQHYAELSERLQQCVEQIVEIQKNNSVQKIVELQNQISTLKQNHQNQKLLMQKRITELQLKFSLKQSQPKTQNKKIIDQSIQTDFQEDRQPNTRIINPYQAEVNHLTQKVAQLTELLHSQSFQHDQSFSQQSRSSLEFQNQIYDMEIMKRKYSTLQQVLQSKKKEILNKDSIIQMLLSKEIEKTILTNPHLTDHREKVKQLVFQIFGYMNGKLTDL